MSNKVSEVKLRIDYEIIQHFSQHLYGSPNKAIEELVSNSFDAAAKEVRVYIPGPQTEKSVLVWDDGNSMSIEELHNLWWIARSPKRDEFREVEVRAGTKSYSRKVIGKFGIGKLASYAIGDKITHICKRNGEFLVVRVNYAKLEKLGERARHKTTIENISSETFGSKDPGTEEDTPLFTTPIIRFSENEVKKIITNLFDGDGGKSKLNAVINKFFEKESWTLAVITSLKNEKLPLLTYGRLNWLLGTGMPLRPDFQVWLNDTEVTPKLKGDALHLWDFGTSEIQDAIKNTWEDEIKDGRAVGSPIFGTEIGLDPNKPDVSIPFVQLPYLGKVFGEMRIFDESLVKGKASELARSHGFFVLVRGRLLNPDDDKLYIKHPSYGAFYRSQFIINADGLDAELLADREHLNKQTPRTVELEALSQALYLALRSKSEAVEQAKADRIKTESLLPVRSRDYYREPINALLGQEDDDEVRSQFAINNPLVKRKSLRESEQLSLFAPEEGGFQINESHPLYRQIRTDFGEGTQAKRFYRFFEAFAIADRLLEGHLYLVGLEVDTIAGIMQWRDEQLRTFADSLKQNPSDLEINLWNTSFKGKKEFEDAIAEILGDMGFDCSRDGAKGKKDGIVAAPIGVDSYKLTFEAKGSGEKYKVKNDAAEVSGAASHAIEADASNAVIIAREFEGFELNPEADAAILQECRATKNGMVSIMTVEALQLLHRAMNRFHYRLDLLKDIFTVIESPAAKIRRIQSLNEPMISFDYQLVLNKIWKRQKEQAQNDVVAYRGLMQDINAELGKSYTITDFDTKLQALEILANGRIELNTKEKTIFLRVSPDHLVESIEQSLANQLVEL